MIIHEGDVLRVTEWRMIRHGHNRLRYPAWAQSIETGDTIKGIAVVWLQGGILDEDMPSEKWAVEVIDYRDTFTVVPPEEWPDYVCAAVAKRALAGE